MVFNRRNTVTNRDLFESGAFIKCVGFKENVDIDNPEDFELAEALVNIKL